MDTFAPLSPQALRANAGLVRYLNSEPGHDSVVDLAAGFGRDVSNLSKSLTVLETHGLLLREPTLHLTDLGRALLKDLPPEPAAKTNPVRGDEPEASAEGFAGVLHQLIVPDLLNPRKDFGEGDAGGEDDDDFDDGDGPDDDEGDIDTLADSIAAQGLLQNLVVRPLAPMEGYGQPMHRLVAGERRWRAIGKLIKRGDWPADRLVPCRIVTMDDEQHAVVALLENLQRKKLKPLEEARAFRRLVDEFGLKTADIAEKINFNQRVVQQRLQLLKLDDDDQAQLDAGQISVAQARRLVARATAAAAEEIELSDAELLIMAELVHKWTHLPKRKSDYYIETEIRGGVTDEAFLRLKQIGFIQVSVDTFNTERTYARRGYRWPDKLDLPAIPEGTAIYRTPWLNPPFPISKEGLERLEKRKIETAKTKKANAEAKVKAAALAADVAALISAPLPLTSDEAPRFGDLMKRAGSGWPWVEKGDGVEAVGRDWGVGVNLYGVDPSLRRLLTFAVNAAGADQTQGRPQSVACNHLFGISLNEVLILRALFDLVQGAINNAAIADEAGVRLEDVEALVEKIVGKDGFCDPGEAAPIPDYLKRIAGVSK